MNLDETIYIQAGLAIFSTITSAVVVWVGRKFQKRADEQIAEAERHEHHEAAQDEALCSLLRARIIAVCLECIERGYKQLFMSEAITHMHHSYKALGGNGSVENLYEQFKALPVKGGGQLVGQNQNK